MINLKITEHANDPPFTNQITSVNNNFSFNIQDKQISIASLLHPKYGS